MAKYTILRTDAPVRAGMTILEALSTTGGGAGIRLEVEDLPDHKVADVVLNDPTVAAMAPEMPTILIEPTQSGAATPAWGIAAVGADKSSQTGVGVKVAVLDTGIDAAHPAFAGMTLNQRDFSGDGNGDRKGHGTHCAGTIFGRDVAGTRIGIAKGVQEAYVGKVLTDAGNGSSDMLFQGLLWAMQNRVHVISMSLGFDFPGMVGRLVAKGWPVDLATSVALEAYRANLRMFDSIMRMNKAQAAFGMAALVVAAAGNESRRQVNPDYRIAASLPAAADDVLSVAAVGKQGAHYDVADFSNSMAQVCGPGVDITSAVPGGGLSSMNGTSMACPHVAGVAALWCQNVQGLGGMPSAEIVRAKIIANAHNPSYASRVKPIDVGVGLVAAPD